MGGIRPPLTLGESVLLCFPNPCLGKPYKYIMPSQTGVCDGVSFVSSNRLLILNFSSDMHTTKTG